MSVSVYVAGSSARLEHLRVRRAMDAIAAIPGAELAVDWLAPIESGLSANVGLTDDQRRMHAVADLRAVRSSHVFWMLAPVNTTRGAWCELGAAWAYAQMGANKIIVVSGVGDQSIFCALGTEVGSDDNALAYIREFVAQRQRVEGVGASALDRELAAALERNASDEELATIRAALGGG